MVDILLPVFAWVGLGAFAVAAWVAFCEVINRRHAKRPRKCMLCDNMVDYPVFICDECVADR